MPDGAATCGARATLRSTLVGMTATEYDDVAISHRPERQRYELALAGEVVGIAAYDVIDGVTVFNHTVVRDAHERHGLAGRLVEAAISDVTGQGGTFAATCSYVQHWLEKNHQFDASLVPPPAR